jgi:hypothetical protein
MGLRHEELQGMVVPLISIDEFEPKTGTTEEVIVIAFFCKDEVPAYDLDDFIDKGIVEFLDSEVSPNPNEDNFYLVFVEFKRQPNFWMKLFDLVKDIENVTGKMGWKVQPYLSEKIFDLHNPELQQYVITDPDNYVPRTEIDGSIEDYLSDTNLLSLEMEEGKIALGGVDGKLVFEFLGFDNTEKLLEKHNLVESAIDLRTSPSVTALRSMLGKQWDISRMNEYLFVNKIGDSRSIVVREL